MLSAEELKDIGRLWSHVTYRRRSQFKFSLLLMFFASLSEMITIGAVLPFLGVMTAPDKILAHPYVLPVGDFLGIDSPNSLRNFITSRLCLCCGFRWFNSQAFTLCFHWAACSPQE